MMMKKKAPALALLLALAVPLAASADDSLARFEGGIGVITVKGNGTPNAPIAPNLVQGVVPGGFPWVIKSLSADVTADGQISANGRGLLLAGGNGIGTNGGQNVKAVLFCAGKASESAPVPLDADGDFRINGALTPTPLAPCSNPVLLIENANGAWFAAGIPKR